MLKKEYETTKKFWAQEVVRGNLIWPDESVIRFVKRNCAQGNVILDYGCGVGRNAIALAKEGYNLIAMDYNQEAIDQVDLKKGNLNIKTIKNQAFDVPLLPESVDAIVACGSMFYFNREDTIKILMLLKNSLVTGGKFWANWRSKKDWLFEHENYIGDGLCKMDSKSGRENISQLFVSEQELRDLYLRAGFEIEMFDDYIFSENNRERKNYWYHVVAVKR